MAAWNSQSCVRGDLIEICFEGTYSEENINADGLSFFGNHHIRGKNSPKKVVVTIRIESKTRTPHIFTFLISLKAYKIPPTDKAKAMSKPPTKGGSEKSGTPTIRPSQKCVKLYRMITNDINSLI